jgi:hypothetical protein
MYWPQIEKNPISRRASSIGAGGCQHRRRHQSRFDGTADLMLTQAGWIRAAAISRLRRKWAMGCGCDRTDLRPARRALQQSSPPRGLYLSVFGDNSDDGLASDQPDNRWAHFVNAAVDRANLAAHSRNNTAGALVRVYATRLE